MPDWTLKGLSVLVVEDYAEMRKILRDMVFSLGARRITEATTGAQAVAVLEAQPMDLVICDYNLGTGKDGQQVLEEARHRGFLLYSSVFAMITADSTTKVVMSVVEHEPDDYLTKPVTVAVMRHRLKRMLARKAGLRPIAEAVQRGDYPQALVLCDEALAAGGARPEELRRLKAQILLTMGDTEGAQALYLEALEEQEWPWAVLGYGRTLFLQGRLEEARDAFERVLAIRPAMVVAHDWLARTLDALGDSAGAQAVLEKAIETSPRALQRQRALARLAEKNGDEATAREAYAQAVALGRHSFFRSPADYVGLARLLIRAGELREVTRLMNQMRRLFGARPEEAVQAGVAEYEVRQGLEQAPEAGRALERAAAVFFEDP